MLNLSRVALPAAGCPRSETGEAVLLQNQLEQRGHHVTPD